MSKFVDPMLDLPWVIIHRFGPVPIVFVLPISPQRVRWSFPSRTTIHQTLTDNYVDDFSGPRAVLAQVHIQGTFGHDPTGRGIGLTMPGSLHLKTIETVYETFNALDRQLKKNVGASQELLILSRLQAWQVVIKNLEYDISNRDPLLYYYSFTIVRILDYLSPVGPSLPTGIPGVNVPAASAIGDAFGSLGIAA